MSSQDIITGDELISDSYDVKEIDGAVYEADCKKISVGGESVDIGANPSAEGEDADEGDDSQTVRVLDLVDQFRLVQVEGLDKKAYTGDLKSEQPLSFRIQHVLIMVQNT